MVRKYEINRADVDKRGRFSPGEIWQAECTNRKRAVLILGVGETFCTTLMLSEDPPEGDVEVASITDNHGIRYYSRPGMINYRFFENMMGKMGDADAKDMAVVRKMAARIMGIAQEPEKEQEPQKGDSVLERERDFYKEEYLRLIERFVGRGEEGYEAGICP